jgi:DNA modification methylase
MTALQTNVIHTGDALAVLKTMPDNSINCVVTSPPYFGLRDYQVDGQIGLEPTPREYVEAMTAVFAEVRRVLTADGTCWVNLGDSYAKSVSNNGGYSAKSTLAGFTNPDTKGRRANESGAQIRIDSGVGEKNLIGIPWRVAFGLQDDGWILRSDIIWSKPSCMPESVTDRPTRAHEYVFLLTKSPRYWYDAAAIQEKIAAHQPEHNRKYAKQYAVYDDRASTSGQPGNVNNVGIHARGVGEYRNARTVWQISTEPTPFAHFATMPKKLVRRCIVAGCPVGGVVLDPFSGSGTTALVARREGRQYVGIELNPEYVALSNKRLDEPFTLPMLFAEDAS